MLYKCKNCGGELAFDPTIGKLKCKFCDAVYDLSEYEDANTANMENSHDHDHEHHHDHAHDEDHVHVYEADALDIPGANEKEPSEAEKMGYTKSTDGTTDIAEDLVVYQCPHCGAEVVTDKTTAATNCIFCDTPLILQEQVTGQFKPDYVIPFEVDKKKIKELYEKYIKTKPFYPKEYSTANVIDHIKAVYLPFWMFDFKTAGALSGTGEKTWTRTTRDWIITEHDVFQFRRQGAMDFTGIPAIASSKTPRNAADSIEPYDYSKMVPYNSGYLPGFLAERYDLTSSDCETPACQRADTTLKHKLQSTIMGYQGVVIQNEAMNHHTLKQAYTLLPAYILFMDYKGGKDDKLIAINGQTGKIVGNVPVDKKKRLHFFLMVFIPTFLILLCLFWFLLIG